MGGTIHLTNDEYTKFVGLSVGTFGWHNSVTGEDVHTPIRWKYATSSDRLADINLTSVDIDKLAFQISDSTVWILISITPITWVQLGGNTGITGPISYNDLTDIPLSFTPDDHTHQASDLSGVVKTINGEHPDLAGDIVISTGIKTINGNSPDVDGNIEIPIQLSTSKFYIIGPLTIKEHDPRWYPEKNITTIKVYFSLGKSSINNVSIALKLNGTSIFTDTIPTCLANTFKSSEVTVAINATPSDYFTVSVLTNGGENATVCLVY